MITVGITAYREAELLKEAWESLQTQTCKEFKIIIILDGGADDLTKNIFDKIHDERVTKIRMEVNKGPYQCRNIAIEACKTDIYYLLDGDDRLPSNAISIAYQTFSYPMIDYMCGDIVLFWENGVSKIIESTEPNIGTLICEGKYPGLVAFKKRVWQEVGGYPEELSRGKADMDFLLTLIEMKYKFCVVNKPVYEYRQRNSSISSSYKEDMANKHEIILKRHPKIFEDQEIKKIFLINGYILSANACFESGDMKNAAMWAKKGIQLTGVRPFWPLHWSNVLPHWLLQLLIFVRQQLGILNRLLLLDRIS